MSAYICDREHIKYLVQAAQSKRISDGPFRWRFPSNPCDWKQLGQCDYDDAAEVANMLLRENYRSVSHRYPHESSATLPGPNGGVEPFKKREMATISWHNFDPAQVIKSCNCYAYQACETEDWEQSEAYAFIDSLKESASRSVPGYEAAEWGAPKPNCNAISLFAMASGKI